MKKLVKNTLVLVCICAVVSVILAITNAITAPIIEQNEKNNANQALLEVMPDGKSFEVVDISGVSLPDTVREVYRAENGGYVFKLNTTGYSSGLIIMCGVRADGTVSGAVCLSSTETLGYEKTFGANFADVSIDTVLSVDTVSGATKTTGAYRAAVQDALNAAINALSECKKPKTNGDRIRQMKDEELAHFMVIQAIMGAISVNGIQDKAVADKIVKEIIMEHKSDEDISAALIWLKQEAKDDAG